MAHVLLDEMTLKKCRDEPFLLVNDSRKNIVIFSCQSNLDVLETMDTIFVDGTFEFCTKFFKQLFTVHGVRNGHYVQLCYGLLADKSTKNYEDFLDKLTTICPMTPTKAVVVQINVLYLGNEGIQFLIFIYVYTPMHSYE